MSKHLDWLVIANGDAWSLDALQSLAKNKQVIVLDGALNQALYEVIQPHVVLGDFDSIDITLMASLKAQGEVSFVHAPDQSATDLEKALNYLAEHQPSRITICQATGLRLDHTLHNLRLLKRYHDVHPQLVLLTESEKVLFLKDQTVLLSAETSKPLALMAFPSAMVTAKGLEYDMQNYPLTFAECESTSNKLLAGKAEITVEGEALLIVGNEVVVR